MKPTLLLAAATACLALTPAGATEVGLFADRLGMPTLTASQGSPIPPARFAQTDANGFGLRGAVTVLDAKAFEVGVAATWHPMAQSRLDWPAPINTMIPSMKTRTGYLALGAQAEWKWVVSLHAALEARRERISTYDQFGLGYRIGNDPLVTVFKSTAGTTTCVRPWARIGIGYQLPAPGLKPFLRLELARALRHDDLPVMNGDGDDVRRAIAPRTQTALYAGVRF